MISVVIPTFNAERTLGPVLSSLVPAVVEDVVREAIIVDGGSTDETCLIAEAARTTLIRAPGGGVSSPPAAIARATGCSSSTLTLCSSMAGKSQELHGTGTGRKRPNCGISLRSTMKVSYSADQALIPTLLFALPYGDRRCSSLVISKRLGGFKPLPMEDIVICGV
jgi:glycosyltransferase involved in cell wall biosynthesis